MVNHEILQTVVAESTCPVYRKDGRVFFRVRHSFIEQAKSLGAKWDIYERAFWLHESSPVLGQMIALSGFDPYYMNDSACPAVKNCPGCSSFGSVRG